MINLSLIGFLPTLGELCSQKKEVDMRKIALLFILFTIYNSIMAQNVRQSSVVLTDEICDVLRRAAIEKSREMNLDISFAIADADGLPRLFQRFGDALVLSTILVPAKAYTSAITQTPTGELREAVSDNGDLMGINTCDPQNYSCSRWTSTVRGRKDCRCYRRRWRFKGTRFGDCRTCHKEVSRGNLQMMNFSRFIFRQMVSNQSKPFVHSIPYY